MNIYKYSWIYKITSPSGRIYIGQTTKLKKRMRIYANSSCKGQPLILNSINKHGFEAHSMAIIKEGIMTKHMLDLLEIYYIKYYKSFHNINKLGMNLTLGGGGIWGYKFSTETLEKVRKTKSNTPPSLKQIEAGKRLIGVKRNKSKKWINNNAEAIKKPLFQYTLDGTFINSWKSATDVENTIGISRKAISLAVRGLINTSGGFLWSFEKFSKHPSPVLLPTSKRKGVKKPVVDLNTGLIYKSITEMGEALGIKPYNICNRLRSKYRVSKYKIDYYEK